MPSLRAVRRVSRVRCGVRRGPARVPKVPQRTSPPPAGLKPRIHCLHAAITPESRALLSPQCPPRATQTAPSRSTAINMLWQDVNLDVRRRIPEAPRHLKRKTGAGRGWAGGAPIALLVFELPTSSAPTPPRWSEESTLGQLNSGGLPHGINSARAVQLTELTAAAAAGPSSAAGSVDGVVCGSGDKRCFLVEAAHLVLLPVDRQHNVADLIAWDQLVMVPPAFVSIVYIRSSSNGARYKTVPRAMLGPHGYPAAPRSSSDATRQDGFSDQRQLRLVMRPNALRFFWHRLHELLKPSWPTLADVWERGYRLQPAAHGALTAWLDAKCPTGGGIAGGGMGGVAGGGGGAGGAATSPAWCASMRTELLARHLPPPPPAPTSVRQSKPCPFARVCLWPVERPWLPAFKEFPGGSCERYDERQQKLSYDADMAFMAKHPTWFEYGAQFGRARAVVGCPVPTAVQGCFEPDYEDDASYPAWYRLFMRTEYPAVSIDPSCLSGSQWRDGTTYSLTINRGAMEAAARYRATADRLAQADRLPTLFTLEDGSTQLVPNAVANPQARAGTWENRWSAEERDAATPR